MIKRRKLLATFALGLAFVTVGACNKGQTSKVINVAGSFPITSVTNTGAYAGTLNISVTYN